VLRQRADGEVPHHAEGPLVDLVDGVALTVRDVDERPVAANGGAEHARAVGGVDVPRATSLAGGAVPGREGAVRPADAPSSRRISGLPRTCPRRFLGGVAANGADGGQDREPEQKLASGPHGAEGCLTPRRERGSTVVGKERSQELVEGCPVAARDD
jgi:hypothetical protein